VPDTKSNEDDADILVDETNKSSADDLGVKERHSIEIDLMHDTIRKQLLKDQYGVKTMDTIVPTVMRSIPWMMKRTMLIMWVRTQQTRTIRKQMMLMRMKM
jgi:flagellar biosynthesis component FlhA